MSDKVSPPPPNACRRLLSGAALFLSLPLMIVLAGVWAGYQTRDQRAESLIRAKVARAQADLRTIAASDDPAREAASLSDPFDTGTYRLAAIDGGTSVAYSVGPDKTADFGVVLYDATNGTVSAGDLVVRMVNRNGLAQ